MADYNVNMKQWNGTSFDNVLPLAYNAKRFDGQSLADVEQWAEFNGYKVVTGQYVGNGSHGKSHPTTIVCPFEPIVFLTPSSWKAGSIGNNYPIVTSVITVEYIDISYNRNKRLLNNKNTI